ncbi:MAG: HDOD domain-containing protein [Gammaproteobacteria bacterium]
MSSGPTSEQRKIEAMPLEQLAREDSRFTVRLLSGANSGGSAPTQPIKSIKDAPVHIAAAKITHLVASLAVERVFVPTSPFQVGPWRDSIQVDLAAQIITKL